ncbi:hypothetical protein TVAG_110260 [Trichomonas vaginalis G3]|uniref:Glycosyl transferase 64 domain-containing protein n=1 Tax=Trichomonas vaginalis (strain ATCC PRA-98 / G3) TaxID=412133 RepID=A2DGM7_TRIV3|nr:glucuronosyl-N-acetylglucosaminyl-proteoglycan 4-alpha-N-acetylglucosaminyltransferase protein [Trichomonas vaginalis G3]EAY20414.1 hypothetical protein TVAG_110260 [Trichomonas vaginalis G3]KAI5490540.1 glucuronosyl-N-acetylglucosaminyl-proteoglycan 4-alpha-N-acetylglucosaminyltransferase protein [Trichomonas vaginalis G3]|eukprot:XP_001581400.1 hypothetical protein [Trichomonas vaginalis G3]
MNILNFFASKQGRFTNFRSSIPLIPFALSFLIAFLTIFFRKFYYNSQIWSLYPEFDGVDEKLSIIIVTHAPRKKFIRTQLKRIAFGQVPHLKEIFIYWADRKNPLPDLSFFGFKLNDGHIPVNILPTTKEFVSERFKPPQNLTTQTILAMDDDLLISGSELDRAFVVYIKNNFTNRIFGLRTRSCPSGHYRIFEYNKPYTMALTNFAFLNVKMLEAFNKPEYSKMVDYITENRNGEDILMNFIIAKEFQLPPIVMKLDVLHLGIFDGFSAKSGHLDKRSNCCKKFSEFFGENLVEKYEMNSFLPKTW